MALNSAEALERTATQCAHGSAELDAVLATTWTQLVKGAQRSAEPFHLGVLATMGTQGPSLRTVVLRAAFPERRRLLCHTDRRAGKLAEIQADERVAWLFYDAKGKVQLRLSGKATVHTDDELAKSQWQRTQLSARRCYLATHAPGIPIATADGGLPATLKTHLPTAAESERGWEHFAVVVSQIEAVDWLHLSARGHRRAQFRWHGNKWKAAWVAP